MITLPCPKLVERLEKATGGDREIDLDLMVISHGGPRERYLTDELGRLEFGHQWKFTASLDAALALVERVLPGWSYGITSPDNPEDDPALQRQHFSARLRKSGQIIRAHAPTPALALCLAALKALAQGNEGSDEG